MSTLVVDDKKAAVQSLEALPGGTTRISGVSPDTPTVFTPSPPFKVPTIVLVRSTTNVRVCKHVPALHSFDFPHEEPLDAAEEKLFRMDVGEVLTFQAEASTSALTIIQTV